LLLSIHSPMQREARSSDNFFTFPPSGRSQLSSLGVSLVPAPCPTDTLSRQAAADPRSAKSPLVAIGNSGLALLRNNGLVEVNGKRLRASALFR
jgi:hypothetical protein